MRPKGARERKREREGEREGGRKGKRERERERERVAIDRCTHPRPKTWKAPTCMGTQGLDTSKEGSFMKNVRADA